MAKMNEDYCDLFGCESGFFTRDDLNELIDDINDNCPKGLSATEAYMSDDDKTLEVVFSWDEYGEESVYKRIDMRQIRKPSDILKFTQELIKAGKEKLGYVSDGWFKHNDWYAGIKGESLTESSRFVGEDDPAYSESVLKTLFQIGCMADIFDWPYPYDAFYDFYYDHPFQPEEDIKEVQQILDDCNYDEESKEINSELIKLCEEAIEGLKRYIGFPVDILDDLYEIDTHAMDSTNETFPEYVENIQGSDPKDIITLLQRDIDEEPDDEYNDLRLSVIERLKKFDGKNESLNESVKYEIELDTDDDEVEREYDTWFTNEDDAYDAFYEMKEDERIKGAILTRTRDDHGHILDQEDVDAFGTLSFEQLTEEKEVGQSNLDWVNTWLNKHYPQDWWGNTEVNELTNGNIEIFFDDLPFGLDEEDGLDEFIELVKEEFGEEPGVYAKNFEDGESEVSYIIKMPKQIKGQTNLFRDFGIKEESLKESVDKDLKKKVFDFLAYYTDYESDDEICNHAYDIVDKFGIDYVTAEALNREFVEKQLHKYRESLKEGLTGTDKGWKYKLVGKESKDSDSETLVRGNSDIETFAKSAESGLNFIVRNYRNTTKDEQFKLIDTFKIIDTATGKEMSSKVLEELKQEAKDVIEKYVEKLRNNESLKESSDWYTLDKPEKFDFSLENKVNYFLDDYGFDNSDYNPTVLQTTDGTIEVQFPYGLSDHDFKVLKTWAKRRGFDVFWDKDHKDGGCLSVIFDYKD